jgi:Jacalin-like lectin domain
MVATNADAGDTANKLFNGYDSIANGMLNASAVTGGSEQSGGRSVVNIRVCESVSELAKALEIDGSLSISYLKAVNVTAKMKFMQKLNATARSITIVVYASHEEGNWSVKNVKLAEGVKAPTNDDEAADFAASYGDSYVSEATQGGEYYAVYTFHTETQTEQRELTASLKAKGVYTGVTANLDVQTKLSDFLKTTSTNWTFDQEITGHKNPKLPNQDELIKFALDFPSKALDSPVTTGFKVAGYEGVPGINRRKFAKIVENRDHFLGPDGVLVSYARLNGVQNQIGWLKRIYARYNYAGDPALLDFEKQVKADLATINKQITAYKRDPAADFAKPPLPSLDKGEPVLSYATGQPISFGGEGGGPFDFMSTGEALRNQVKIASLRFADGDEVVHKMEVGYASDRNDWKTSHGANGNFREIFYLEEGQFPIRFNIRCDDKYIYRIEVFSSDGRSTWCGSNKGSANDWKVPEGAVLLGFAGRSGALLDQVKMMYATLKPARFVQPI